jgi:hypothetical protein
MVTKPIFQTLNEAAEDARVNPRNKRKAREWFRDRAGRIRKINNTRLLVNKDNLKSSLGTRAIGKMFMFYYDPKHKQTLPYYDRFPLVFPIHFYPDGFLGINLHYLPLNARAKLMDALYTTLNNQKMNGTTKLRISYEILKSSAKFRYFRPCVKRYLAQHVANQFLYIDPEDWDKALMLPTERFVKRTKGYVFNRSMAKL